MTRTHTLTQRRSGYKEAELQEFFQMPSICNGMDPRHPTAPEDLIEITQALQEPEAALAFVRQHTDMSIDQPTWYEKLGHWDKALKIYLSQIRERPALFEAKVHHEQAQKQRVYCDSFLCFYSSSPSHFCLVVCLMKVSHLP